jgi:aminoglycoside 6'-N-acetyltransferase
VTRAFCAWIFEQGLAARLVIDPDLKNTRAIRAYEKAGFVALGIVGDEKDTLLMEMTRDAFEVRR